MKKQTIEFAVITDNNVVSKIGRVTITQPKPQFKGGSIKWLPEKVKPEYQHLEG